MPRMTWISNHRRFWISLLIAVATIAVYAPVYRHDFIDFDDAQYVFENWHVTNGLTLEGAAWAFTATHEANWHPLTWLSHMLDCQVFGVTPGPQHLVNLLIHVANALLLFVFLQGVTGAHWKSAFVAALFALHPLHVESVAWIAERKDVLSTLFFFLALLAYARYSRQPLLGRYLLTLLFFALGLLAKPMLVSLPFVLLLLDYWPLNRISVQATERGLDPRRSGQPIPGRLFRSVLPLIREKVPFFVLSAISSTVTYLVQGSGGAVKATDVFPFDTRVANAIHSYFAYLVKAVWPTGLSVFYPYSPTGYPGWSIALAGAFLLCVTVLAIRWSGRLPYFMVGWLWYLVTLVPVIGLIQVGWQAMADRYTYIPLIGISVLVAWSLSDLASKRASLRRLLPVAGVTSTLVLSVAAWLQVRHWKDTMSLFSHALEVNRENFRAHETLATALAKRGQYHQAMTHYSAAMQLRPENTDIINNLGSTYYRLGKVDEALGQFKSALAIKPDDPLALRNMGLVFHDLGRFKEAFELLHRAQPHRPDDIILLSCLGSVLAKLGRARDATDAYRMVLHMRPDNAEAHLALGIISLENGNLSDASVSLHKAIERVPDYAEAYNGLGNVSFRQGQTELALSYYSRALQHKPGYAEAHYNMGVALYAQGKRADAISHYREAIRLRPGHAEAFYNLGNALDAQGDLEQAMAMYAEAIRLKPDYADAHNNLGVALFKRGEVQEALDAFSEALRLRPDHVLARRNRDLIVASLGKRKGNS